MCDVHFCCKQGRLGKDLQGNCHGFSAGYWASLVILHRAPADLFQLCGGEVENSDVKMVQNSYLQRSIENERHGFESLKLARFGARAIFCYQPISLVCWCLVPKFWTKANWTGLHQARHLGLTALAATLLPLLRPKVVILCHGDVQVVHL